ncbi:hypothetical protein B0H14DRAFT_3674353 [Mycena olivaceomarginata]|nr:hypothetical protein B0H14DRAFT_3674353 [Mycena olivaceomarginata]
MPSTRSLRVRATPAATNRRSRTGPKANPSQTDPYPLPEPVAPLVLPTANIPLEELLAHVFPDVDAQAQEKAFRDMIQSEGSKKAAVALLQSVYNNLNKYPVEGAKLPPTGVALRTINTGPHAIFYHRTYPAEVEADHPFFWSFYVGCAGKGPGSIITDFRSKILSSALRTDGELGCLFLR